MFAGCDSLLRLPKDFSIPAAAKSNKTVFQVKGTKLPMYYDGKNGNVTGYVWEAANRELVSSASKPGGAHAVALNIKAGDETGPGSYWTTAYTDASGKLAEPGFAPSRPGMVFTLWYSDSECTQRVDFSEPFAGNTTLYGVLAPGMHGGALPTKDNVGAAFWSLDADGTLYIRGGGVIDKIGWDDKTVGMVDLHWSTLRSQIKKVAMAPSCKVQIMEYWFTGCENLFDIEGVVIPEGTVSTGDLFSNCTSLRNLPENFSLPTSVGWTFSMFKDTPIASLPANFCLPVNINNCANMFKNCRNLTSLPKGFSIPKTVGNMPEIFYGCDALTMLPDDFSFPAETVVNSDTGKNRRPFFVSIDSGAPLVPLYYGGCDPAVLNFDWASQNRVLIADSADRGMFEVTYKLVNIDGTWSTRSTALTDTDGMVADIGAPLGGGYGFTGWCADEDCLEPFDFSQPVSEPTTLYGKWTVDGGALPTTSDKGNTDPALAGWTLGIDGTLSITCLRGQTIDDLHWGWEGQSSGHWSGVRASVRRIAMGDDVRAYHMNYWFKRMTSLEDASGVFVPEDSIGAYGLFYGCSALKKVPASLTFPESATNLGGMFQNCTALEEVQEGFALPATTEHSSLMFRGCTELKSLPESLALPKSVSRASSMFNGCTQLESLPKDFMPAVDLTADPDVAYQLTDADNMFYGCAALASLPEGFAVPESVGNMDGMFANCSSLTVLPDGFDFPVAVAEAAKATLPFQCKEETPTCFNGGAESAVMKYTKWADNKRTVQIGIPDGSAFVDYHLPDGEGVQKLWTRQSAAKNSTIRGLVAPGREGASFLGWYTDAACTSKASFPLTVDGPLSLYAKYAATSGALPTTDAPGNDDPQVAGWSLSDDGTLRIWCEPGEVIGYLGWNHADASFSEGKWNNGYWGPLRDEVRSVNMDSSASAINMNCWFAEMHNLSDISKLGISTQAKELRRLFFRCTSLVEVPDEFDIPEGVECVSDMFAYCRELSKLPSGFELPRSVVTANHLFDACAKLTEIPMSFLLREGIKDVRCMFIGCSALRTLPVGFTLPSTVNAANGFISGCSSLEALPSGFALPAGVGSLKEFAKGASSLETLPYGFSIPAGTTSTVSMFEGCTSLKALPEGFAFSNAANLNDVSSMFGGCTSLSSLPSTLELAGMGGVAGVGTMFGGVGAAGYGSENGLPTYYAGEDLSKLGPTSADASTYWLSNYGRALFTAASKPAGTHTVCFVLVDPATGEAETWMSVSTDNAKISRPADPALYGYAFDGWYRNNSFTADSKVMFDENNAMLVDGNLMLFGKYTLQTMYQIPTKAKVKLDPTGKTTSADVQMRSFTPVPLKVTDVSCDAANAASEIVGPADIQNIAATILPEGAKRALPLGVGESGTLSSLVLPAAQPGAPGVLNYSIGLDIPDASVVKLWRDGWSTDLVCLKYTMEPAA